MTDFNGWPDRATETGVSFFGRAPIVAVFEESLSERNPRSYFIKSMIRESKRFPALTGMLGDEIPDWGDVFDSLIDESGGPRVL